MAFQNTTLGSLKSRLAERYDGRPFWTADQARRAINEALRLFNVMTGAFRTPTPRALATVPNDPFLPVGGDVMKVTQIVSVTSGKTLNPTSLDELDAFATRWEGLTTASGGGVPTSPRFWAPVGLTEVAVYPADDMPDQSQLQVDGILVTTPLVNDGDYLPLDDSVINDLLGYALHVLSFRSGAAALQNTRALYINFLKMCAARNAIFAASSIYRKLIGLDRLRFARPMIASEPAMQGEVLANAQQAEGSSNDR